MSILVQLASVQPAQEVAAFLFYALALLTCVSAWSIVLSQNIVRMSVYLLLTLGGAAGMYLMLDAEFLAAIQLVVYAGGTLILIVFGIMLTSKNPFVQLRAKLWELVVGAGIGLSIAGLLVLSLVHSVPTQVPVTANGTGYRQVAAIGHALLTGYLVPFEVAAVLLLVVMIAAAFMARQRAD